MAYKILVVDDDLEIVGNMIQSLLFEGYKVESAFDGEEAMRKMQECNPDIIILDIMMPRLDGIETLKQIREKFNDKWRPVIIISGKSELETINQCNALEADHYLVKPFKIEDLLSALKVITTSVLPAYQKKKS